MSKAKRISSVGTCFLVSNISYLKSESSDHNLKNSSLSADNICLNLDFQMLGAVHTNGCII